MTSGTFPTRATRWRHGGASPVYGGGSARLLPHHSGRFAAVGPEGGIACHDRTNQELDTPRCRPADGPGRPAGRRPPAAAIDITATWTGGGDGHSYSDPANWDVDVLPINVFNLSFDVVIPAGGFCPPVADGHTGGFCVDFDVTESSTIRSLTLGDDSELRPLVQTCSRPRNNAFIGYSRATLAQPFRWTDQGKPLPA